MVRIFVGINEGQGGICFQYLCPKREQKRSYENCFRIGKQDLAEGSDENILGCDVWKVR